MKIDELLYLVALSYNRLIGPRRFALIVSMYPDLKDFFNLSIDNQMTFLKIKNEEKNRVFFENSLKEAEKIIKTCEEKKIEIIHYKSENYPENLRRIYDPPFLFYKKGQLKLDNRKLIAIVGTRKPTKDFIEINRYFTRTFVRYNIGIVSGLASGHDSIAQAETVENYGYTIGVLGCGIDIIYPEENKNLFKLVEQNGAIISEYPPGTPPDKKNFPIRNRLISGLADAVLIVQAPKDSGALYTARYAEEQNKDLYVIPASPNIKENEGSNDLIQKGAKIALDPVEVIRDLLGKIPETIKNEKIISKEFNLTEEEDLVYSSISENTYFDELYNTLKDKGFDTQKINYNLTILELKGLIIQNSNLSYSRK